MPFVSVQFIHLRIYNLIVVIADFGKFRPNTEVNKHRLQGNHTKLFFKRLFKHLTVVRRSPRTDAARRFISVASMEHSSKYPVT